MRGSERLLLLVALLVPVVLVAVVLPRVGESVLRGDSDPVAAPARERQPEVGGVLFEPAPPSRPVRGATAPEPSSRAQSAAAAARAPQPPASAGAGAPAPQPAVAVPPLQPEQPPDLDSPARAVAAFYDAVNRHEFEAAAQLWSPRMRAAFPPPQHLVERFSPTREIRLERADIVTLEPEQGRATVAVELVEVVGAPAVTRRYSGTWQLVRGAEGWLLEQPDLTLTSE